MADNFQDILYEIVHGLQDGILGTLKIPKLGKAESEEVKKDQEPMTTLARRRAERNKDKETVQIKEREPKIIQRIIMCCAWNGGIFLMSIFLFNHMLLPIVQLLIAGIFGRSENTVWGWIGPILSWTFSALWILPIFVLSKVVNSLWFQDIADAAYFQYRGKPKQFNISSLIADISFSMLLQALFLIQGTLFMFLPIPAVGQIIGHIHMALLYSLYAFEYKWLNMGWEVHKRLSHIESYWPYFLGFGLPMAVMTSLHPSVVISGCIFSILFPVFIISANEASEPTRTCAFPLKVFAPVVALSNAIFRRATVGSTNVSPARSKPVVPPTGKPKKHVGISKYSQEFS
ncbi:etoposide-induced protein 2.4 homolog [Mizuhopecten yessoensis]|uniref:Etoposide-induced protein 2.4-like n=1 Tax=Mizuhopecten yessoensis TaxID=6573 RepID=A0A210Q0Q1_MIZYE|nr:etoposide-induced protein 2.4 homolog [Mizuhopecten yessoensis]OWF42308.1 Etoposide-induced protein 2.4-like [Mizuhopecten yessoensis]